MTETPIPPAARAMVLLCVTIASAAGAQVTPPADDPAAQKDDKTTSPSWAAPEPWRTDRFYVETSVYTRHFNTDSYHDDHQRLIDVQWNVTERWFVGAAAFNNSFGQPSQFAYGGIRLRPFDSLQPLYFKLAAGVVHGYKGEYQHKIPFNSSGIAPTATATVGYCVNRFCSELAMFGTAAIVVTVGMSIP